MGAGGPGRRTLVIENGGEVSDESAFLKTGSTARVTGTGSKWVHLGDLHVEEGTLTIADQGFVSVGGDTVVGHETFYPWDEFSPEIQFDNGTIITGGLLAPASFLTGTGTIRTRGLVSDLDLVFDSTHPLQQTLLLKSSPGQNVTIHLDLASNPARNHALGVGCGTTGTLLIADGLTVRSSEGYLGRLYGSEGTARVTGDDSAWEISGDLYVGKFGTGRLIVDNGGCVTSAATHLGSYYHLPSSPSEITVRGTGSSWTTGDLDATGQGIARVTITEGGGAHSASAAIGSDIGAPDGDIVTVRGSGSLWTISEELHVGQDGYATLNIEGGGQISSGPAHLGTSQTNMGTNNWVGTANVTGAGSQWNVMGPLTVGGAWLATGVLTIADGAQVISESASVQGKDSWYPPDSVTVNGDGSLWLISEELQVGTQGTGIVTIEEGGLVSSRSGCLGCGPFGDGTVTVTGSGSRWDNSQDLFVGGEGSGMLTISDEGQVAVGSMIAIAETGSVAVDQGTVEIGDTSGLAETRAVTVGADGVLYVDGLLQSSGDVLAALGSTIAGHGTIEANDVIVLGVLAPGDHSGLPTGAGMNWPVSKVSGNTGQISAVPEASSILMLIATLTTSFLFYACWRRRHG